MLYRWHVDIASYPVTFYSPWSNRPGTEPTNSHTPGEYSTTGPPGVVHNWLRAKGTQCGRQNKAQTNSGNRNIRGNSNRNEKVATGEDKGRERSRTKEK